MPCWLLFLLMRFSLMRLLRHYWCHDADIIFFAIIDALLLFSFAFHFAIGIIFFFSFFARHFHYAPLFDITLMLPLHYYAPLRWLFSWHYYYAAALFWWHYWWHYAIYADYFHYWCRHYWCADIAAAAFITFSLWCCRHYADILLLLLLLPLHITPMRHYYITDYYAAIRFSLLRHYAIFFHYYAIIILLLFFFRHAIIAMTMPLLPYITALRAMLLSITLPTSICCRHYIDWCRYWAMMICRYYFHYADAVVTLWLLIAPLLQRLCDLPTDGHAIWWCSTWRLA